LICREKQDNVEYSLAKIPKAIYIYIYSFERGKLSSRKRVGGGALFGVQPPFGLMVMNNLPSGVGKRWISPIIGRAKDSPEPSSRLARASKACDELFRIVAIVCDMQVAGKEGISGESGRFSVCGAKY
jgi:hypothetical protein